MRYRFEVLAKDEGKTLYIFLRYECGLSSRLIKCLKRTEAGLTVNGQHAITTQVLHRQDMVGVCLPQEENKTQPGCVECLPFYEDAYLLAFDKPPDMPVHPSRRHQTDTLANAFAVYALQQGFSARFRALNRLDKDTSGLVLLAKDAYIADRLPKTLEKEYIALIGGVLPQESGVLEFPIERINDVDIKRQVGNNGQYAKTIYRVIGRGRGATLVSVRLETGRTHQIRVHFSHIGHPLIGDSLYGGDQQFLKRQALHCAGLQFVHPVSGENVCLRSPFPADFEKALTFYCVK